MTQLSTEKMNIVIVGHVDHGKSTLIGRLLADTGSLPEGKLEQVRQTCERNAKPFEYAFLLDALKDEQAQGITIDSARCFFKTDKRHYIIIDAPGHIEFLKNMVTGASRAEAALLLIDANEGVQENSKRHGYMLSMLGIKQITVLVNKMDLVDYDQKRYDAVVAEYTNFLKEINVTPLDFIPISARDGENLTELSAKMPWYDGVTALERVDLFEKEKDTSDKPFRLPVQDIYKFTNMNDDRRIVVGTVVSGTARVGDRVNFLPSGKSSTIKSIESFNTPTKEGIGPEEAVGITLDTEIYIRPGELVVKADQKQAEVGTTFRVNLFWLGKKSMIKGKRYKLKIGTAQIAVYLKDIQTVLDASELDSAHQKGQIDRHDVAEVTFQTLRPISFDLVGENEQTSRFVIVDDYEIAGGGIIIENCEEHISKLDMMVESRAYAWRKSDITPADRAKKLNQDPTWLILTGMKDQGKFKLARALERALFDAGKTPYFLGVSNVMSGLDSDVRSSYEDREEHLRRLGELAHLFSQAGLVLISVVSDLDDPEVTLLKTLHQPHKTLITTIGDHGLSSVDCELPVTQSEDDNLNSLLALI